MRDVIVTKDGPAAIGPYSQAIKANGLVFVSGQIALDPVTNTLVTGDVAFQTDRVLKNLAGILRAAGTSLEKVVRATVFLKNMDDFTAMNEVYGKYFHSPAAGNGWSRGFRKRQSRRGAGMQSQKMYEGPEESK